MLALGWAGSTMKLASGGAGATMLSVRAFVLVNPRSSVTNSVTVRVPALGNASVTIRPLRTLASDPKFHK